MINPNKIINYNRSASEIEELIIFTVAVAGKNARTTAQAVERFLEHDKAKMPFEYIRFLNKNNALLEMLRFARIGNYHKLAHVYTELTSNYKDGKDLLSASREELCQIKGVGMKTASCFLGWCLPNVKYAMLDIHILRYMAKEFSNWQIPKSTPSNYKKYLELETLFLNHCENKNPAEFDLEIWRQSSKNS